MTNLLLSSLVLNVASRRETGAHSAAGPVRDCGAARVLRFEARCCAVGVDKKAEVHVGEFTPE